MTVLYYNCSEIIQVEDAGRIYKRGEEMKDVAILHDAWMLVSDGKISAIGEGSYEHLNFEESINMKGQKLMPSFVDSHSHLVYAANREDEFAMRLAGKSYAEIAAAGGGILNSAAKMQLASEDELLEAAKSRLDALIKMGTGAIEIKSGYGLNQSAELK
ncbi:MAG: imidazolonepropionase, partial [Croceimicrobium sp.]